MSIDKFKNSWNKALDQNKSNRYMMAGMVLAIVLLVFDKIGENPIVVISPPNLMEEANISVDDANKSYLESWAVYLSMLLGNVTPANVDFLKQAVGPHLDTAVYQDVMDILEIQAMDIKLDNIKRRFEQQYIETEGRKTFVFGYTYTETLDGKETRQEATFEYMIKIKNYKPIVAYIDTYNSRPRNAKVLATMERREQARKEREEKAR